MTYIIRKNVQKYEFNFKHHIARQNTLCQVLYCTQFDFIHLHTYMLRLTNPAEEGKPKTYLTVSRELVNIK